MAQLKHTSIPELSVASIGNITNLLKIDIDTISIDALYTRRVIVQSLTTTYTTSTSNKVFGLGLTYTNITNFQAGSLINLHFHIPTRNNIDSSWGGIYIEPQVRFNEGTWMSLGGLGYDLMYHQARQIHSYSNNSLFDPLQEADFSAQFRFYFAKHDGASGTIINGSHSINSVSGTATIMTGANGLQHWSTIKVEELAKLGG